MQTCRDTVGPILNVQNDLVTDEDLKCEIFNKFFCSVFTQDNGDSPVLEKSEVCIPPLFFDGQVLDAIKNMRKDSTPGPDRVTSNFIKCTGSLLAPILEILFSRNIKETFVPDMWKRAFVTPIYKNGAKIVVNNYRPISLTCHLCKLMERVITNHIMKYLLEYNKLETFQHGFCRGLSTVTNLLVFYDEVMLSIDRGIPVDVVFYDLTKAFDKVSHCKLQIKLKHEGIVGPILS